MGTEFKIGVDGGATHTRAILIDSAGAIVAAEQAGGSNPNSMSRGESGAVCDRLVARLREQARARRGRVVRTLLFMAGDRDFWRSYARQLRGVGRVTAGDDSLPILELGTGGKPGVVLHAGTGSFVVARNPAGTVSYHGGLGWKYGDEGGGYDLGRRAIAEALREAQDGPAVLTAVGALVRRHARATTARKLERAYYSDRASVPFVAQLGGGLLALAGSGDAGARRIILASTGALLALAAHVAARLFPASHPVGLGLSGPVLTHPFVASALESFSPFALYPVSGQPIEGVRRLLERSRGAVPAGRAEFA